VKEVFAAPGNAGTAQIAHNLNIPTQIASSFRRRTRNDRGNVDALLKAVRENKIDLTVVGPEAPLAEGIVDRFSAEGLPIFGASKAAAEIETSKVFAKELMQKYKIPCAKSASFSDFNEAKKYVQQQRPPIVIKADGLAAGKGVIIAESVPKAIEALSSFMEAKTLGAAGNKVVIEEFLNGKEMSAFVFTDGKAVVPVVPACDYKRVFDGDKGPNTGGMGSYSPPYFLTPALEKQVMETIMVPTVKALAAEGRPYRGVLYGGLMITTEGPACHSSRLPELKRSGGQAGGATGRPKALEFNARFGDPEAQVILPRLKTDLIDIIFAILENKLAQMKIEWREDACVGVVMASGGYPGNYKTGFPIHGLNDVDKDIMVFHAGTKLSDGQVVTNGGRVLTVVATGKTIADARKKVYDNISRISFEGAHYRKDIALIKA
jgi:phosphoribosylamine--glycine ligase